MVNSACPEEIRDLLAVIPVDGVTMNPSLLAKYGHRDQGVLLRTLLSLVDGPIFAQVTSGDYDGMLTDARALTSISERIVVKIPCTRSGFLACRELSAEGASVNMTLCFSPVQAVLAARNGARWVSPFVGRLDDAGRDGASTLKEICSVLHDYGFSKSIAVLAASLRNEQHIAAALTARVHAITLDPAQLRRLSDDPLTDEGAARFLDDWQKSARYPAEQPSAD